MELLQTRKDWIIWKSGKCSDDGDDFGDPKVFPCYAYTIVSNWTYEYIKAIYLIKDQLTEMISKMD